jgi:hypothetical protein
MLSQPQPSEDSVVPCRRSPSVRAFFDYLSAELPKTVLFA